uniref:Antigenic determinant of rec-A protein n=1 Tax=Arundo donax TaxID=35708 RepID=A0A0A9EJR5_ARUDO
MGLIGGRMPGCSQWTQRNSVQKCRLRRASMMGRFSELSNMRTFARLPSDVQCNSFHFLYHHCCQPELCNQCTSSFS